MDFAALAALAGNALVAAAVTDAWEDVRGKVARWFGRGRSDPAIERRLEATRERLSAAAPGDLERARADEAGSWRTRFADLLSDYPDAAGELDALVGEIRAVTPVIAGDHSVGVAGDMVITADNGSVAAGVIHGDVTMPGPAQPGQAGG
ncbi:MAG TPA: hypothetical protein VMU94_15300 [Streptosporangiaceae bacterium]|nr:hypothetical protein [Streptosporangiaceae bacterium]